MGAEVRRARWHLVRRHRDEVPGEQRQHRVDVGVSQRRRQRVGRELGVRVEPVAVRTHQHREGVEPRDARAHPVPVAEPHAPGGVDDDVVVAHIGVQSGVTGADGYTKRSQLRRLLGVWQIAQRIPHPRQVAELRGERRCNHPRRHRCHRLGDPPQRVQHRGQLYWLPGAHRVAPRDVVEAQDDPAACVVDPAQSGSRHVRGQRRDDARLLAVRSGKRSPGLVVRGLDEHALAVSQQQSRGEARREAAALGRCLDDRGTTALLDHPAHVLRQCRPRRPHRGRTERDRDGAVHAYISAEVPAGFHLHAARQRRHRPHGRM
ncbi:MAG: hypothetical protein WKF83_12630 [Nocardioidaceae bacterium]